MTPSARFLTLRDAVKTLICFLALIAAPITQAHSESCENLVIAAVDPWSGAQILNRELQAVHPNWSTLMVTSKEVPAAKLAKFSPGYRDIIPGFLGLDETVTRIKAAAAEQSLAFAFAGTDGGVPLADALNSRFNLPGNDPRTTHLRTDKSAMLEAAARLNIPGLYSLDHALVGSEAETIAFAQRLAQKGDLHGITKPRSSSGTDRVSEWRSAEEAVAASRQYLGQPDKHGHIMDRLVAVEFASGDEVAVNTVSWRGRHEASSVFAYAKKDRVYLYADILDPNAELSRELFAVANQLHTGVGLLNGPSHTEFMIRNNARPGEGRFALIEINPRPAGWPFSEAENIALGTNQTRRFLELMKAGANEALAPMTHTPTRLIFLRTPNDGTIKRMLTAEDFSELPTFKLIDPWVQTGSVVKKTVDTGTLPGLIVLSGDPDQIAKDYARFLEIERDRFIVE